MHTVQYRSELRKGLHLGRVVLAVTVMNSLTQNTLLWLGLTSVLNLITMTAHVRAGDTDIRIISVHG